MDNLPIIGITMGDPSGIGPEIILKTLSDSQVHNVCRPIVLGDSGAFELYPIGLKINLISKPEHANNLPDTINFISLSKLNKEKMIPGSPSVEGGTAMVNYIRKAVELAQQNRISAMVTCPINKALMNRAGFPFEGHTQLISKLTNTTDYVMMLAGEKLRVTLVTIHCGFKDVLANLNEGKIYKTIKITAKALENDFGINKPHIAVAALNPHAGESGLFGQEETEIIEPAIQKAIDEGMNVSGPYPADTLFFRAAAGAFDAVVSMYHDQGLIPLKLLHFSDAVNITLGLPIIRTSVDHGTAYDIAGKNIADASSLKAAINMAVTVAKNRKTAKHIFSYKEQV